MRKSKRLLSLGGAAFAVLLAVTACGGDGNGEGNGTATPSLEDCAENPNTCNSGDRADGGEIVWMINQGWDAWNHNTPEGGSVYAFQALHGVFPSIGQYLPDGSWEWNMDLLASEPEMTSESPQTIVYQIREEAVWNDGTPIGVNDFLMNWYHNSGNEEQCTGCNPRSTGGYELVENVEGSDDGKTVTVTFQDGVAYPEWHAMWADPYPVHVAEAQGFDWRTPAGMGQASQYWAENVPDWSGGPYLIESATIGETVVKVPNPQWYGETQPTLERQIIEVIDDPGSWIPALTNGEIHGGAPAAFNVDVIQQLQGMEDSVLHAVGGGGAVWEHIDINTENEWLSDVALRQAIFTAIDTQDMGNRIFGDAVPNLGYRTNHVFSQVSEYHVDHLTATGQGSGDADRARQILTDAGYEIDGNQLTKDGEAVGPLRFRWLQGNTNRATAAELVQSYLSEIGLTVNLEPSPPDQLGSMLAGQDYDIVIFGWSGSPLFTTAPQQYWSSASGSNFGKYSNAEVDRLVAEVQNQTDIGESARLANEAVAIVMNEAYVLPLWDSPAFAFISNQYINVRDNNQSSLRAQYNHEEWGLAAAPE